MQSVTLQTSKGSAHAVLIDPQGSNGALQPGLVVVHEWWGLNDDMRAMSERFSREGFAVIAVDLFAGQVTTEARTALKLSMEMKTLDAMEIIESAAKHLRARVQSNGKVGVTGFCLGGAMALAAACHCPSACAFVPFYGLPLAKYVDWSKTHGPIQGHYARQDDYVDAARLQQSVAAVNEHGGSFELHVYDALHAFMRDGDPKVYSAPAAALAWQRTLQFLRTHLS